MSATLTVLGWHNIEPSWLFPARPGAGTRGLRQQLGFLRQRTNVVGLADALAALAAGGHLPPRAVALTFDDGYLDQLERAAPLLQRFALPATFFLVPGLLSRCVSPWWEELAQAIVRATRPGILWQGTQLLLRDADERRVAARVVVDTVKRLDQRAREHAIRQITAKCEADQGVAAESLFLDWVGARELSHRGFAIGSHSMRHTILANESYDDQVGDLRESRRHLEDRLGAIVRLLAYPNGQVGDYDDRTMAAVRSAGYSHAITTLPGRNLPGTPRFEVRRFVMQPERGVLGLASVPLAGVRRHLPLRWPSRFPIATKARGWART